MLIELTYMLYLAISIAITVWVARSLSKNGRVFLVDSFGNEALADSVNHLLVVGFYLINIGYVTLALRLIGHPDNTAEMMEYLSSKIGLVLVVLGVMHFFNIYVITKLRRRLMQKQQEEVEQQQLELAAEASVNRLTERERWGRGPAPAV